MDPIRVLVVDDSSVVRRIVKEALAAEADLTIAAEAATGIIAIEQMRLTNPDLVVLDIEMPEMDGLTALTQIHKEFPRTPVIMFSSLTELGAKATLEALSRGASDFFAKPSGAGGIDAARALIRVELVPAIRALCAGKSAIATKSKPIAVRPDVSPPRAATAIELGKAATRIDVVAIGASTGGPNALAELFAELPSRFPVPIVVVQHMPPMFTQLLAARLTKHSQIATAEAEPGVQLEPGKAYLAPGDFHLVIGRDGNQVRCRLHQGDRENACRPAVDPLFRSVAEVYGKHTLAVVLTGMGQDGLKGCESIHSAGGQIIVQDEASSVVWGMPGYVSRAGLADRTLPLALVAGEISRRVSIGRV